MNIVIIKKVHEHLLSERIIYIEEAVNSNIDPLRKNMPAVKNHHAYE